MRAATCFGSLAWLALAFTAANALADGALPPTDLKPFTQAIAGSGVSFEMVPIPAGEFLLGSPEGETGRNADEGPQVKVKVEPFFMGKFEVTRAEYDLFREGYHSTYELPQVRPDQRADAVTYPTPMYVLELGPQLERMGQGGRFPAVFVSYYAARQYTKWVSKKTGRFYRLPTEAEWEYACRAGTTTAYSFGDDPKPLGEYAWYYDNSQLPAAELKDRDPAYREAGRKKPNPWGLYDMHGNVAEMVIGQYDKGLYAELAARPQPIRAEEVVTWPAKQYPRIARGGSFESEPSDCRSAARNQLTSHVNAIDPDLPRSPFWYASGPCIGFRLVSPVAQPDAEQQARYWDELDSQTMKYFKKKEDRQVREVIAPDTGKPPAK
jgi:formylglycine-generating enzyme required for sulfatase activity